MYVITVAPIVRAASRTLTYFSPKPYPQGALVQIPVGKKAQHDALVLDSQNARDVKTELRTADYALRKIAPQEPRYLTSKQFIDAIQSHAHQKATTAGALLQTALPKVSYTHPLDSLVEIKPKKESGLFYIQDTRKKRYEHFKHVIRSSFARNHSVIILAPTRSSVELLSERLTKGIEKRSHILHSGYSQKKQERIWKRASGAEHPILFITTPHFLALPRGDIGTIITEEEGSSLYEAQERPFLNFRMLAREYADAAHIQYIAADTLIRTQTYAADPTPATQTRETYKTQTKCRTIDMNKYKDEESPHDFNIFSPHAHKCIQNASDEKVLLFLTRRGTYPLTQCSDCGTIVKCQTCNYPLVLYKKSGKTVYTCHMCNRTYDTHIRCHVCQGWRLNAYGIGIERIAEIVSEEYPDLPLFVLDGSAKEQKKALAAYKNAANGILIALPSSLPYIEDVDSTVVVSIDTLFAVPDIGMNEVIARILLELRDITRNQLFIQIRNADKDTLTPICNGDAKAFFDQELKLREQLLLPPTTTLIKISWKKGRGDKAMKEDIRAALRGYDPDIYSSFYRSRSGHIITNALITVQPEMWPDPDLKKVLSDLPPSVAINVYPESIL